MSYVLKYFGLNSRMLLQNKKLKLGPEGQVGENSEDMRYRRKSVPNLHFPRPVILKDSIFVVIWNVVP